VKGIGVLLLAVLMAATLAFLVDAADPSPASADAWTQKPDTGLRHGKCVGPEGIDETCGTADDYDGQVGHNSPDLRGPDNLCGTADDLVGCFWGTDEAGGQHGCFTNNNPNCAAQAGAKSAQWSGEQVFKDNNCLVDTTVTNTSAPQAGQPATGCINQWSSPRLPNLQAAMVAEIAKGTPPGIPPATSVTATDGPGSNGGRRHCTIVSTEYSIGYNPESDLEPAYLPEAGVGGITEPPDVALGGLDAPQSSSSADSSDSAARGYAVLAGGLAAAVVAITAGAWYARRRWLS